MNRIAEVARRLGDDRGPRRTYAVGHHLVRGQVRTYLVLYTKAARQAVADLITPPHRGE